MNYLYHNKCFKCKTSLLNKSGVSTTVKHKTVDSNNGLLLITCRCGEKFWKDLK